MSGTIVPANGSPAQSLPRLPMHTPVVDTDGGPWAEHDMACPVCWENKAMLNLHNGVFFPCDSCREKGWEIGRIRVKRVQRWFNQRFAHRSRFH
jgi:hypothetical protein